MLTQNETAAKASKDLTETNESAKLAKSNDTPFSERPSIVVLGTILIPTFAVVASFFVGSMGYLFTQVQHEITHDREVAHSASQAKETKEHVLTDYSKTIADLLMKEEKDEEELPYELARDIARGHTLIALRRLNPDESQEDDSGKSKAEAGELKGLLIRYLFENEVIGYPKRIINKKTGKEEIKRKAPMINLGGADLEDVILEDAWMPYIGLRNAELSKANFIEADLRFADLSEANLSEANLSEANLRFADLSKANLSEVNLGYVDLRFSALSSAENLTSANLNGACYVEGTEAEYFPLSFDPDKHGMVAIPEDKSNPSKSNFQPCITL